MEGFIRKGKRYYNLAMISRVQLTPRHVVVKFAGETERVRLPEPLASQVRKMVESAPSEPALPRPA